MELIGDVGLVEFYFGPFRDSVSVCCKIGVQFAPNIP
jgi:hypothetical protein